MWDFTRIRDIAITSLKTFNMLPLAKILLAREFNIHNWEWEGYVDLITRPEMLSTEDALKIGYADSIKIFQMRESLRPPRPRLITGLMTETVKPYFQASSLVVQTPQPVPIEEPPSPNLKGKHRWFLYEGTLYLHQYFF
ncbi:hypothetical protein VNI00_004136 [Paramarasmius palmivorus]|uniref:Uncharacterized protein n=1 Tax=Paramarasmius palmivorus TaxID=297713 RepID=A0AAW0DMD9_9AGAR